MTIEHSTISFGEIHPVANWAVTVGGVAALGGIPAGDGDIGKVAWVAGVGHYVLASTSPTVWESLGVTIMDMTYDIPSATLSIALSDGTTHSVVIVAGLSESEVNTLITDALDDYDVGIKTYISESITSALGALTTANIPDSTDRRYVSDAQLAVLGNTSGTNSGDETQAGIKLKLGAASSAQDGYLTSTDWSTFNGKQAALADVITAGDYGSSTQYPVITFNAKGIATGVTLQTVPTPTFTDATFSVQKNGSPSIAASWDLSALTARVVHTYPDKAINFGDLSFVASTNSNTLSGARTHIICGSNNTVSGADVTIVNSNNSYFTSCTNVQAHNVWWVGQAANLPSKNKITYNGSSFSQPVAGVSDLYDAALGSIQCLYTDGVSINGSTRNCTLDGNNTLGATNCAPVLAGTGTIGAAVHDIDFIVAIGTGYPLVPVRHLFAKRRVYAQRKAGSIVSSSTVTIDTDTFVGDAATGSTSVGITVDFTNNRLVPTITGTSGSGQDIMQASVRITSHFNRK